MQFKMEKSLNISLNQNLWALVISLAALGIGEFYCLEKLTLFGCVLSIISGLSCSATLIIYTIHYFTRKLK